MANEVKTLLPELKKQLPESVNLSITMDDSVFVQDTVNDTLSNILLGIIFTAGILLFFLHDLRSTLIVAPVHAPIDYSNLYHSQSDGNNPEPDVPDGPVHIGRSSGNELGCHSGEYLPSQGDGTQ